ncbi:glycosyltransferase [Desulfurivibrio alkaliphilus]|uniref:Glycosyl transferase group 1 n=1 Tax=Desulfurivibrio alkaliphilus (strain DSM 19089 / UNIQEM U267 / AHT2) TaxID=589865 RepID=D6Z2L4_DESAT|nr:glycosyltransferase [Desulfurivibrio alkaliphilus]ADH85789.1 glycosyl transferase group 1 [Desulfurivibrio alkaliphilus AHT 2]
MSQPPDLTILAPLKAWGGIERKIMILCREFLAQGVRVQLLLARGGEVPYPDEFPDGVEVVDLRNRGKQDGVLKVARYLRRCQPRALLTAKDHAAKIALVGRALARSQVPIYVKVTNTLSETLRRPVKRYSARWLYPRANRLIAVSSGVRSDLIDNFAVDPEQVEVIYNPTVTPDIAERRRLPMGHPWLAGDGPPVVMGIGRLTPQKDFVTLLRAFARLRRQRLCRLIILGEGPLRNDLQAEARELGIAEDVDLPGYVQDPIPWLARASLFVLSSRYEGLANVVIEALAAGTPVVCTDCPSGPDEILLGGRLGPLVPIGEELAMSEAMAAVLAEPPPAGLLQEGLERFRSDKVAAHYLRTMGLQ